MDAPARTYVIVSGPPGSGKTTLARALASELNLPLLAKDAIKESLMSVLPVPDIEASRQLGRAAVVTMYALAADAAGGAVLENCFHRSGAPADLNALPGHILEVFCRCEREVALERYRTRAPSRHSGHFDVARSDDDIWSAEVSEPVAAGWPVFSVDTTTPVDVARVIDWLRSYSKLASSSPQ